MRLSETQQQRILEVTRQNFGDDAKAWLFGSRVDDTRRGGDVDLYIETRQSNNLMAELRCKMAIEESLDPHVDLVVNDHVKDKPIYKIAKKQGVQLCDPLDNGLELIAAPVIDQFNIGPGFSCAGNSTSQALVGEHIKSV